MSQTLTVPVATRQLMATTFESQGVALPFAREIFLIETHVAGLVYHQAEQAWPELAVGQPLHLRREPGNPHDDLAIHVHAGAWKLGYVPRQRNPVLARLMDAGKELRAEIRLLNNGSSVSPGGYRGREIRFAIVLCDH